jgi:hypothetical protein
LNADDFYGFNAYKAMAGFLTQSENNMEFAMVGYKLSNTLSDYGSVSRGICAVNSEGLLQKIVETTKIIKKEGTIISIEPDGSEKQIAGDESASMNMWGFKPSVFDILEKKFTAFLKERINEPKSEIYIPSVVFDMIADRLATVKVLKADSPWFGVTYKEDKPIVIDRLNKLIKEGQYPEKLF